jgi:hypothetical protein
VINHLFFNQILVFDEAIADEVIFDKVIFDKVIFDEVIMPPFLNNEQLDVCTSAAELRKQRKT